MMMARVKHKAAVTNSFERPNTITGVSTSTSTSTRTTHLKVKIRAHNMVMPNTRGSRGTVIPHPEDTGHRSPHAKISYDTLRCDISALFEERDYHYNHYERTCRYCILPSVSSRFKVAERIEVGS
jgi:hypothetical protein